MVTARDSLEVRQTPPALSVVAVAIVAGVTLWYFALLVLLDGFSAGLVVSLSIIASTAIGGAVLLPRGSVTGPLVGLGVLLLTVFARPGLIGDLSPWPALILGASLLLVVERSDTYTDSRLVRLWSISAILALIWPALLGGLQSPLVVALNVIIAYIALRVGFGVGRVGGFREGFITFAVLAFWWQILAFAPLLFNASDALPVPLQFESRGTWVYGLSQFGSIVIGSGGFLPELGPRLTGWLGEPSILAGFAAVVGLLDLGTHNRYRLGIHTPVALVVFLTQSLSGVMAYAAGIAWFLLVSRNAIRSNAGRRLAGLTFAAMAAGAFFGQSSLSLRTKAGANSESISDRLSGTSPVELMSTWLSSPLGIGASDASRFAGINLLQSSISWGPVVLVLWLFFYLGPIRADLRSPFVAPAVATVVMVLFSQPPYLPLWLCLLGLSLGSVMNGLDSQSLVQATLRQRIPMADRSSQPSWRR